LTYGLGILSPRYAREEGECNSTCVWREITLPRMLGQGDSRGVGVEVSLAEAGISDAKANVYVYDLFDDSNNIISTTPYQDKGEIYRPWFPL
jgi:hypothetical protein